MIVLLNEVSVLLNFELSREMINLMIIIKLFIGLVFWKKKYIDKVNMLVYYRCFKIYNFDIIYISGWM